MLFCDNLCDFGAENLGVLAWNMTQVWSAMKEVPKTSEKKSANFWDLSSMIPNVADEYFEKVVIWTTLITNDKKTS